MYENSWKPMFGFRLLLEVLFCKGLNFGLAIDVFPIWSRWQDPHEKGRWCKNIRLLKLIAHVGIEEVSAWGGNWRKFKDYPHFELKVGKNMAQLRAAVKAAGVDPLAVKYDI